MLVDLTIKNFAIIDHLQVGFAPGLNVITGETGAGKSIMVGALDFLLGGKVFKDMIRSGEKQATVEASFDIQDNLSEIEDTEFLIIRRELFISGKSKAYINGRGSTLQQLRKTGKTLIDIMGQHEHQSLLDPANHLAYLDALGDLSVDTQIFSERYRLLEEKEKHLIRLRSENEQREERKRFLEFQIMEIDKAALKVEEEKNLIRESKVIANAEKILQTCRNIIYRIQEEDISILGTLSGFGKDIQDLSRLDENLKPMGEGVDSARIQLEEVVYNLEHYLQEIDFDPQHQVVVEERLDEIYRLKKKYRRSVEELLIYRREMEQDLRRMEHSGEEETELAAEVKKLSDELSRKAQILSQERKKNAEHLQRQIVDELALLGIPECRFLVHFSNLPATGKGLEVNGFKIEETGLDRVNFLFSANPGETPKDLSRIISGGELSRIMLGLKNLLGKKDEINTLIFDEVDVGIGGRTAIMVGKKLQNIAANHQIICITHLPQIARFADRHLVVDKVRQANRTVSRVRVLTETEQSEELARMTGQA